MQPGEQHIAKRHTPIRKCVGCRGTAPQAELLRIVAQGGNACPDPRRRLPGRGAYVHHRTACLDRVVKRGVLSRALRTSIHAASIASLKRAFEAMFDGETARPDADSSASGQGGRRSSGGAEKPPIHGLTQPMPRFVVATPNSKDQK